MKGEVWKRVAGFETHYMVSSYGRVKSLKKRVYVNNGKCKYSYLRKEYVMKPVKTNVGYPQVTLHKNGCTRLTHIHRLVAEVFIPNPKKTPQVNHKDGNKQNNNVENLEWVTAQENSLHAHRELGIVVWHKHKTGASTPRYRSVVQRTLDGDFVKVWECGMDAVRTGTFDSGSITRCCQGVYKSHKGYKWEYAN